MVGRKNFQKTRKRLHTRANWCELQNEKYIRNQGKENSQKHKLGDPSLASHPSPLECMIFLYTLLRAAQKKAGTRSNEKRFKEISY